MQITVSQKDVSISGPNAGQHASQIMTDGPSSPRVVNQHTGSSARSSAVEIGQVPIKSDVYENESTCRSNKKGLPHQEMR